MKTVNDRDDELGRDVRNAFAWDYDREEFERGVMDRVQEPGGGEHEISVEPPRSHAGRWAALGIAAAAVILIGLFLIERPGKPAAGIGDLVLPGADGPAAAADDRVLVEIPKPGEYRVRGRSLDLDGLKSLLREKSGAKPGEPSEVFVIIRAGRDVKWEHVQKVMQACAAPDIRIVKIQFVSPKKPKILVGLRRVEKVTQVRLGEDEWVSLDSLEPYLPKLIRAAFVEAGGGEEKSEGDVPRGILDPLKVPAKAAPEGEVHAGRDVPWSDVERIAAAFEKAGVDVARFTGEGIETVIPEPDALEEEVKPEIEERAPIEQEPAGVEDGSRCCLFVEIRKVGEVVRIRPAHREEWLPLKEGLPLLSSDVKALLGRKIEVEATIEASPETPHASIIAVIDAFMALGVKDITFVGTPR